MSNFIPHFTGFVITCPFWDWRYAISVKGPLLLWNVLRPRKRNKPIVPYLMPCLDMGLVAMDIANEQNEYMDMIFIKQCLFINTVLIRGRTGLHSSSVVPCVYEFWRFKSNQKSIWCPPMQLTFIDSMSLRHGNNARLHCLLFPNQRAVCPHKKTITCNRGNHHSMLCSRTAVEQI